MKNMALEKFNLIFKDNRYKIKDKEKLLSKLKDILGEENVSTKEIDKLAYSKDSTLITLNWRIHGQLAALPQIITWPENKDQIIQILKLANEIKIPVIPYGEGSGVVGGAIPVYGGIIVDMKKFNKLLEVNDKDLTVTVQAGMNGMNLERYLNAKGYTGGHIPQSIYMSSVGGWIAHRAAGQFSTKYGKIEDIILGLEVVLPKGDIIELKPITRAATGPQLDKLFTGGEGTLGIVTKATLKIWPYPEKRTLISYAFPTIEDSLEAVRNILRNQIYPAVIRIYDASETERHFPQVEKAKNKIMIVFVCEGNTRLVNLEEIITREKCEENNGVYCGEEPVEHWFETRFRLTETSLLPPYKIVFDTIEVSVMWERAPELYHSVIESIKKVKGVLSITAHASHFYPNGVGFYFTFAGVALERKSKFEFYQKCWDVIMEECIKSGGSIAHHHGIGINRARWMEKEWGNALEILKGVKKLLDPNNILNPGKTYLPPERGGV